jgi:hypothetical protein
MNKKLMFVCVIVLLNVMQIPEGKSEREYSACIYPTQITTISSKYHNISYPLWEEETPNITYSGKRGNHVGHYVYNQYDLGICYSVFEFDLRGYQTTPKLLNLNFSALGEQIHNMSVFVFYNTNSIWNVSDLTYDNHPFGILNETERDGLWEQRQWVNYNKYQIRELNTSVLTLVFVSESNLYGLNSIIFDATMQVNFILVESELVKDNGIPVDFLEKEENDKPKTNTSSDVSIDGFILLGIIVFAIICIVKVIIESDDPILKLLFFWWLLD